jgi:PAS domain S-box-containing protein
MIDEPKLPGPHRSAASGAHDQLARANARILDLEAALEAAHQQLDSVGGANTDARARDAFERSEARFRGLIDNLHVGVVVQGPRSEILLFNARALELFGLTEDELRGRSSFDPSWEVVREDGSTYLPEERPVAMVLTTRAAVRGVVMGIKRPRTQDLVWLLVNALPEFDRSGNVVQVVATMDDISGRKKLEDELRSAQKLDSLGLLAGGIAHDFNNLLTIITSCAELATLKLPTESRAHEDLDEVLAASERATALTRQLLTFARRDAGTPRRIDINAAVDQFEKLLRRLLGSQHLLIVERESESVIVNIDQGQLEQVLVNLVVNARDAMPDGGEVTVTIGHVGPGRAPEALAGRAAAFMCVSDRGTGIAPELLERVFEPFFTTKPTGQGTGLGLATVHGLVRQAAGQIQVSSTVGVGTEICVYFPLLADAADTPARKLTTRLGAGERIMVVDDDDVLRSVAARMLSDLGYRTTEAADGFEAIDLIEHKMRSGGKFDLLFTDVVMPRMGGIELAQRVRQRWPEIRVITCSGHAQERSDEAMDVANAMLPKPFNMASLGQLVRAVLDE